MRESKVECYLYVRVKELGGECYKFTSPQRRNVPDRIVILPGGRLTFVEVKAPGEKPTDGQQREHKRLWELGVAVVVLDSYEAIDKWLNLVHGSFEKPTPETDHFYKRFVNQE